MFSALRTAVTVATLTLGMVGWARPHPHHPDTSPPTCNDPDPDRLEELWLSQGTWHESMFNVDRMLELTMTLANVSSQYVDIKLQKLTAGPGCPHADTTATTTTTTATPAGAPHHGALCPTYDVINYDANRVPTVLFEKGCCACEACSARAAGESRGRRAGRGRASAGPHSAVSSLGCHPVYYHVKALRRVACVHGVFVYRAVLEPLVVGCACDRVTRLGQVESVRVHSPQQ